MTTREEVSGVEDPPPVTNTPEGHLPYPGGWFRLALSRELVPGKVPPHPFTGEDVVLYRAGDGRARAAHPHCPHLGAPLGAGGTVRGQNLVCPFHRFASGPDGTRVGAPAGPPPRARLRHHAVTERNGFVFVFVFVWYEPNGSPPGWEVPGTLQSGVTPTAAWSTEARTCPQEIIENTLDHRPPPVLHQVAVRELVRAFAHAMPRIAVGKVHQDLRIRNTKRYVPRPRLAASDEATGFFRHGAQRFHPSP
ncbi:Rieske 2Fe-2S domain-containing protein [Streptomyces hirsutus]|uniref:Rieske 2Fe-2S domain-containing protein n=1 Tax=Streptomyces hirsutus TaxID=35620 RepID=UPI0033B10A9D